VVKTNARALLALINDILELSKIEAGQAEVAMERVDVRALANECMEAVRELLREKEVTATTTVLDSARHLRTDSVKLRQILLNLLSNAAKFTELGEILLRVEERDGGVVIQVEDTGAGIPAAQLPFIFEKFRQVDGSTTRKVGGTGLGLAIVKELTRVLGGTVEVSSTLGRGSTFTVQIPRAIDAAKVAEEAARQEWLRAEPGRVPAGGAASGVKDGLLIQQVARKKPRILYVEDNAQNRDVVRRYLSGSFEVLEAGDGEQGVERASRECPDLILMDLSLPRLDGWEATRRLRQLAATERTPIIAVTGHAGREHREKAQAAGCDAYLLKPIERAKLLKLVLQYLPPQPEEPTA
jgi:CheY-like chemotaxis protein